MLVSWKPTCSVNRTYVNLLKKLDHVSTSYLLDKIKVKIMLRKVFSLKVCCPDALAEIYQQDNPSLL